MYLWGQRQQCPPAQTLKVLLKKMYHSARKKKQKKNLHFLYPGKASLSKAYFKYSATELSSAKQGQVAPLVKYTSLIATFYI